MRILILFFAISFSATANIDTGFLDDTASDNALDNSFLDDSSSEAFDAFGELDSVKRYRLEQQLEVKKQEHTNHNRAMSSKCACYDDDPKTSCFKGLVLTRVKQGETLSEVEESIKRQEKKRNKSTKEICKNWLASKKSNSSAFLQQIKNLEAEIEAAARYEQTQKKKRQQVKKQAELEKRQGQKRQEQTQQDNNRIAGKKARQEKRAKHLAWCHAKWNDNKKPCECNEFRKEMPAEIQRWNSCTK
jgi:flagellar biosynthesis GTPase FlhF